MASNSITCPYDGDFCDEKEKRLKDWTATVEYYAEHRINREIYTSATMFDGCPRSNANREKCIRYQRYRNIIRKMKENENQNNGR